MKNSCCETVLAQHCWWLHLILKTTSVYIVLTQPLLRLPMLCPAPAASVRDAPGFQLTPLFTRPAMLDPQQQQLRQSHRSDAQSLPARQPFLARA